MPTCSRSLQITVADPLPSYAITNSSPLSGTAFIISTIQLLTSGGTAPHTFAIIAGSLGAGVTMSASGLITIMTTTVSVRNFTVQATDSSVPPQVVSKPFVLNIVANRPDWAALLWGAPVIQTDGGSASFSPSNAVGASFSCITSSPPPPPFPPLEAYNGSSLNTAVLNTPAPWSGTSRLHIDASTVDVDNNGNVLIQIEVRANGTLVASYQVSVGTTSVSQDFNFSVAGRTQITVQVWCESTSINTGTQGTAQASVQGLFSNP